MQEIEPKESERASTDVSSEPSREIFKSLEVSDSSWDVLKQLADL